MSLTKIILILTLLLSLKPVEAQDSTSFSVISVYSEYNSGLEIGKLDSCYGMFAVEKDSFAVFPCLVSLQESIVEDINGDPETHNWVKIEEIKHPPEVDLSFWKEMPLMLFKADHYEPETVRTFFQGSKYFHPGEIGCYWFDHDHSFELRCYGEFYENNVDPPTQLFHLNIRNRYQNYSLKLYQATPFKSQKIVDLSWKNWNPSGPTLIWAGDINGDQVIDLLFDNSTITIVTEYELYLSGVRDGEIVTKVCRIFRGCGC